MSNDKRKKFRRACDFLYEVNNGAYPCPSLNGRGRWSLRNPVIRYVVKRGMAKIVRVQHGGSATRTYVDTGIRWARSRLQS